MKRKLTTLVLLILTVAIVGTVFAGCKPKKVIVIVDDGEETSAPSETGAPGETGNPEATPSDMTLAQQREKTQIGIWYSLWYNLTGNSIFWENDGAGNKIYYRELLPDGTYGKYESSSDEIMDFHLEEITGAGIDFLIFDQTNDVDNTHAGGIINANSIKMAKKIWAWNKVEGNPHIRYCSAIGASAGVYNDCSYVELDAKKIYERYIERPWGTETDHVYVDGKPLLVLFTVTEEMWNAYQGDKTYTNKFTLRFSIGHAYDPGYWGWVIPNGLTVTEDVACVMPGWYKFKHNGQKVYRNGGRHYKSEWLKILKSDIIPNFIVINSFNEYAEHTAVHSADTSLFPDDYPIEKWIDEDGNPAPTIYWDYTKLYISKYRAGDRS